MKIIGMRWGEDFGGMSCGPVGGSTYAELALTNDKKLYFVLASQYCEFEKIQIATHSLFDQVIYAMSSNGDIDYETVLDDANNSCIENYDYEIGDEPDEMFKSVFSKAIQLSRVAVNNYSERDTSKTFEETAEDFISDYLRKDLETLTIPEPFYRWLEDEDEDETDE